MLRQLLELGLQPRPDGDAIPVDAELLVGHGGEAFGNALVYLGLRRGVVLGHLGPAFQADDGEELNEDVDQAETKLRNKMIEMLHKLQEEYPDSHVGKRWAPQRLGGTAPAPLNS